MAGSMKTSAVPQKCYGASNAGNWYPVEQMRRRFEHVFQGAADAQSILLGHRHCDAERPWSADIVLAECPAVDITENVDAYVISVELPGIDKQQVSVNIVNGTVVIRGEKHEEQNDKAIRCHLAERRFGTFERRFALPQSVDPEHIEAALKTGVLRVRLPKQSAATKASQIMVTVCTSELPHTYGRKERGVPE